MDKTNVIKIKIFSLAVVIFLGALLFSKSVFALSDGQYQVKNKWKNLLLSGTETDWAPAWVAPNKGFNSQKWNFEAVSGTSNEFRISSQWPGDNYLTCSEGDWENVTVAPLNIEWYSQRWIVESIGGNEYRIRCKWGDNKYLHGSDIDWTYVRGSPLNTSWHSQQWIITSTDGGNSPPVPSEPSPEAIVVGFENNSDGTKYNLVAQKKDWDSIHYSNEDDMNAYTKITTSLAHSGSKSVEVTYPDNAQIGVGTNINIPAEDEYYLSYWIYFDDNFGFNGEFDGSTGGKLPGLASTGLCSGGSTCDGTNGFTSRYMWREDGRAVLYLYHMDKPGQFGEDIQLRYSNGNNVFFPTGRWFKMTQRVKINTGNNSDGSITVWLDNAQVLSRSGLRFVNNGNKINHFYFNTFHGGYGETWWPRYTTRAYFDDVVISTKASDVGL